MRRCDRVVIEKPDEIGTEVIRHAGTDIASTGETDVCRKLMKHDPGVSLPDLAG